jgi:MGT family glycosyltransferase
MGKILFFNIPAHGHVNATLPVVAELVRRGHEVIYYCGEDFRNTIEKAGARFCPYPQQEMQHLNSQIRSAVTKNMANIAPLLLNAAHVATPFALAEVQREKPDLLMHDSVTLWGRTTAYVSGLPNVVTYSNLALEGLKLEIDWRVMAQFAGGALFKIPAIIANSNRLRKQYGSDALKAPLFPVKGTRNIVFTPREFQPETAFIDESFVFVGASIDPYLRAESRWNAVETDQPLVYISLGTINNQNSSFYNAVLAAFADYPVHVLMAVGCGTADRRPSMPSNFLLQESVPQLQVLQQADVFITHGGMNSVQEGLYYAVPEIVVPQQLEQLINGVQVAKLGAGILLGDKSPLGQVKPFELRTALETILHDPHYKEAAKHIRETSHAAGGYLRAADEVEALLPTPCLVE